MTPFLQLSKSFTKTVPGRPMMLDCLIHVLGAPQTSAPFSRALGIGRKFRVWEMSFSGSDCQAVTPRSLHVVGLQPRLGGPKNSKYISPSSPNLPEAQISLWCSPRTVKCDIWFQKRSVSLANGEKLARSSRSAFLLRLFSLVPHPL